MLETRLKAPFFVFFEATWHSLLKIDATGAEEGGSEWAGVTVAFNGEKLLWDCVHM